MPEYRWPEMSQRRVMGKRLSRLDGPIKASGRAKLLPTSAVPACSSAPC